MHFEWLYSSFFLDYLPPLPKHLRISNWFNDISSFVSNGCETVIEMTAIAKDSNSFKLSINNILTIKWSFTNSFSVTSNCTLLCLEEVQTVSNWRYDSNVYHNIWSMLTYSIHIVFNNTLLPNWVLKTDAFVT